MSNQPLTRPRSTVQSTKRVLSNENACPAAATSQPVQYIKDVASALTTQAPNKGKGVASGNVGPPSYKRVLTEKTNSTASQLLPLTTNASSSSSSSSASSLENHGSRQQPTKQQRTGLSSALGKQGPSGRGLLGERPLNQLDQNALEPLVRIKEEDVPVRIKQEELPVRIKQEEQQFVRSTQGEVRVKQEKENRVPVKEEEPGPSRLDPLTARPLQTMQKTRLERSLEVRQEIKKVKRPERRPVENELKLSLCPKGKKPEVDQRQGRLTATFPRPAVEPPAVEPTPVVWDWQDHMEPYVEEAHHHEQELEARRLSHATEEDWEDLEAEEMNDPVMVAEYSHDIFAYFLELQASTMPDPHYMDAQPELTWKMRGVLLDWIAEVHHKFRMLPETLFLAVNIMDRFMSLREVSLVKYQLVGITALFIAAKYEEVIAPSIHNYVYMSDGGYSAAEIRGAERYVLQTLGFSIAFPNPMNFLRRVSKADDYNLHSRTIAKYLMELPLLNHHLMQFPPSMVAASAMCLARRMMGAYDWDATMVFYAGYRAEELECCMEHMVAYLEKGRRETFVYKKYSHKIYMKASVFVQEWINGLPSE